MTTRDIWILALHAIFLAIWALDSKSLEIRINNWRSRRRSNQKLRDMRDLQEMLSDMSDDYARGKDLPPSYLGCNWAKDVTPAAFQEVINSKKYSIDMSMMFKEAEKKRENTWYIQILDVWKKKK